MHAYRSGFCVNIRTPDMVDWLDSPSVLEQTVENVKAVKSLGIDVGVDFHGVSSSITISIGSITDVFV